MARTRSANISGELITNTLVVTSTGANVSNAVLKTGDVMTGQLNISSGGLLVSGNANFDNNTLFIDSVSNKVLVRANIANSGGEFTVGDYNVGYTQIEVVGSQEPRLLFDNPVCTTEFYNSYGNIGLFASISDPANNSIGPFADTIFYFKGYDTANNQYLKLFGNRVRIANSGNVGIGTTNPIANLHVIGNGIISQDLTVSGNVGIATASPTSNLHVIGTANVSANLTVGAGSATAPALTTAGDNNTGIFFPAADTIAFVEGGAEAARIDANGNFGLGVTPSAWSSSLKVCQIGNAALVGTSTQAILSQNYYFDGSNDKYISNGFASFYYQVSGEHQWRTAPSGTAGNNITFTQAMTLDASGNLLVGTTTASGKFVLSDNSAAGSGTDNKFVVKQVLNGTNAALALNSLFTNVNHTNTQAAAIQLGVVTNGSAGSLAADIRFFTTNGNTSAERARITGEGFFKASPTGSYYDASGNLHEFTSAESGNLSFVIRNIASSNPYGQYILFSGASPDDNSKYFFRCDDSTTARCYIYSDGDLANHDGVYGTISDQKLKQDIVDAPSQWSDLKSIRFRKYRMKTDVEADPNAPALLGVIAQELEQVSPGLVDEHPDMEMVEVTDENGNVKQQQQPTGTTTKTVKSSILLMKAAVALQEAMTRIEKLETEVAALKGN